MENNQSSKASPTTVKLLVDTHNALSTGNTKPYSTEEIIKMSGIMAQAAAAFYFSAKDNKSYTEEQMIDLYQEVMDAASVLVTSPSQKAFESITDDANGNKKSLWSECEDAYIALIAKSIYSQS